MKKLLFIFIVIGLLSCNKESKQPEQMNGVEFTAKYGIELPFLDYSEGLNRSNKKKASSVTLSVIEDLTISGSVQCTVSPDADWGGIQKFLNIPLSNDGAVSYCNFNWWFSSPVTMNCPTSTPGVYRGWTSDSNYDIHLSGTLTIQ